MTKPVYKCNKCGLISKEKLISHTKLEKNKSPNTPCTGKMIKTNMEDIFPWLQKEHKK